MSPQATAGPVLDNSTLRGIDEYLEDYYASDRSQKAGEQMVEVGLSMAQIRGLQTLITSTTRFSEIINYIKNQAGKEDKKKNQWMKVAPNLLAQLQDLETRAREL